MFRVGERIKVKLRPLRAVVGVKVTKSYSSPGPVVVVNASALLSDNLTADFVRP